MWHEARKHEKKIRVMIVDYRKRAERRREFYEKFKADPTQFMQVHGRPIKIYMDPQITSAAERCLMPWQGNPETTIDRFDVRAHLDYIPEPHSYSKDDLTDETVEPCLNYERYRILIQNDLAGISEDKFLHQIHIEEQYGTTVNLTGNKTEAKPKQPKAAIAYTYDDSTPNASSVSSALAKPSMTADITATAEEDSDEDLDFDLLVNVNDMTTAQKADLNNSGMKYGLAPGDFMNFLNAEIQEKENLRLAKLQEEEKQAMSGRKARRERRAYKDRIIMRKGCISPPSYAATNSPGSDKSRRSSSRSRSSSNSPEKIVFITSFGENENNEGNKRTITAPEKSAFGPSLPPVEILSALNKHQRNRTKSRSPKGQSLSPSPADVRNNTTNDSSRSNSSHSSIDAPPKDNGIRRHRETSSSSSSHASSRSRTRRRSRSRSRSYSRRKSDLSRSTRYRRRSSSRSRSWSRSKSRLELRSRKRSRSGNTRMRSRSISYKRRRERTRSDSRSPIRSKSNSKSPSYTSRSRSSSSSLSRDKFTRSKSDTKRTLHSRSTPVKVPSPPVKRYYGRAKETKREDKSSESLSSSDSEEDKVEAKATGNKVSSLGERNNHRSGGKSKSSVSSSTKGQLGGESSRNLQGGKPQDRLKRQMQKALNRQLKADKEAQKSRFERQEQERLEREESLRELSIKYRRRERERRHRSHTGRGSRSGSSSSFDSSRSRSQVGSESDRSGSPCLEF